MLMHRKADEEACSEVSGRTILPMGIRSPQAVCKVHKLDSNVFYSLPKMRRQKVLGIRKQLADHTYNLRKRLDAVIDKLLHELDY